MDLFGCFKAPGLRDRKRHCIGASCDLSTAGAFKLAQNSNIQLEAVYTRSTSNVEIFTRRRPYFASSVAGAEAAQLE